MAEALVSTGVPWQPLDHGAYGLLPMSGLKAPPTAASIPLRTIPMSRNSRSSRSSSALIAARRSQLAATACAQMPIQRTSPAHKLGVEGCAGLWDIVVIFPLQSAFRPAKPYRWRNAARLRRLGRRRIALDMLGAISA